MNTIAPSCNVTFAILTAPEAPAWAVDAPAAGVAPGAGAAGAATTAGVAEAVATAWTGAAAAGSPSSSVPAAGRGGAAPNTRERLIVRSAATTTRVTRPASSTSAITRWNGALANETPSKTSELQRTRSSAACASTVARWSTEARPVKPTLGIGPPAATVSSPEAEAAPSLTTR